MLEVEKSEVRFGAKVSLRRVLRRTSLSSGAPGHLSPWLPQILSADV